MRATLVQIDVDTEESVTDRRERVAALVRAQAGADLVVLPELWPVGAYAADSFAAEAEPVDGGPTAEAMGAAARAAGVWLHAGSIVERGGPHGTGRGTERDTGGGAEQGTGGGTEPGPGGGTEPGADGGAEPGPAGGPARHLYNTSLLFAPDGTLHTTYRKIHRFGFDKGEAALMTAGDRVATARLPQAVLGLATCYDLRFPELFRLLVDAGAELLVIPAGWPVRRLAHWRLLVQARAVESQAYVLACGTAGTHAGVPQAGHSMVVDPWGEILAEAGPGEELLTVELDPARVAGTRAEFPVLRDRALGLPTPRR